MVKYLDAEIYQKAKNIVYAQHTKHSAYRSMALVKKYKELGGRLEKETKSGGTKRWRNEQWKNLTPYALGMTNDKNKYACGKKAPKQNAPSICRPKAVAVKYNRSQLKKAVEIKSKGKVIDWKKL
tara:strand:+ start:149 stop:523 length:375 start_codon:yes stop_codon:yes gene_type:complete